MTEALVLDVIALTAYFIGWIRQNLRIEQAVMDYLFKFEAKAPQTAPLSHVLDY